MPPESVPVVLYAAKSTEDPRGSIGTQIEDCRRAADLQGGLGAECSCGYPGWLATL